MLPSFARRPSPCTMSASAIARSIAHWKLVTRSYVHRSSPFARAPPWLKLCLRHSRPWPRAASPRRLRAAVDLHGGVDRLLSGERGSKRRTPCLAERRHGVADELTEG